MTPIRPENLKQYPPNWHEISAQIRARAGGRCECRGECGLVHGYYGVAGKSLARMCRVPHMARIRRSPLGDDPIIWVYVDDPDEPDTVLIVLTVAHLDHQPENCDPANLRAFCQLCHNRYDREHRKATAASTRHRRRACGELFDQGGGG